MKKLALAIASIVLVIAPASAAEAKPNKAQNECVVAALLANDFRAAFSCEDTDASTNRIDWD